MSERRDVKKTKAAIGKAYYELLFKNQDEKITVQAILEEANISRGTFYKHYKDIPDLAEQVEYEIINSVKEVMVNNSLENIISNPRPHVEMVLKLFEEHKKELKVLLSNSDNSKAVVKVKQMLIDILTHAKLSNLPSEKARLVDVCATGVIFDVYVHWLLNENGLEWDEMIDIICQFISGGLIKIFENGNK